MAAPVRLRDDFSPGQVRAFARRAKDADQVRRLLAIATILDGGSRSDAAKVGGVTLQIVRDWVLRSNAQGPEGLETRKAQDQIPSSTTVIGGRWQMPSRGPIPPVFGVVRLGIIDLLQWLWEEFEISISKQALGHELRTMGYRKLSARPRHQGQCPEDIAAFKKPSRPSGANPKAPAQRHTNRALVARRGPDRSKNADHPALGQARDKTRRAP